MKKSVISSVKNKKDPLAWLAEGVRKGAETKRQRAIIGIDGHAWGEEKTHMVNTNRKHEQRKDCGKQPTVGYLGESVAFHCGQIT